MSETNGTSTGEGKFDLVEVVAEDVDEDGNVVVDDLITVVGSGGNIVATDETIAVLTADGNVVIGETFSVVGDDGELHVVEEDATVLEISDPAKRTVKKAVKRTPAKKAVKRTVKKAAKRTPAKKAVKRTVKKAAKRTPAKKAVRR